MATHSSILAWRIPWMEEFGGLESTGRKESDTTERLHFQFQEKFILLWACLLQDLSSLKSDGASSQVFNNQIIVKAWCWLSLDSEPHLATFKERICSFWTCSLENTQFKDSEAVFFVKISPVYCDSRCFPSISGFRQESRRCSIGNVILVTGEIYQRKRKTLWEYWASYKAMKIYYFLLSEEWNLLCKDVSQRIWYITGI